MLELLAPSLAVAVLLVLILGLVPSAERSVGSGLEITSPHVLAVE